MGTRTESDWNEMLRDGSRIVVRPICADDVSSVSVLIDGLSSQSRHLMFLAGIAKLDDAQLQRLCDSGSARDAAFVAVDPVDPNEPLIGLVRYAPANGEDGAEIAVAVAERWRHKGLGTLLLRHLIEHARTQRVRRLYSIDSATNYRMQKLARKLGFTCRAVPDDRREVICSLTLADDGARAE